MTDLRIQSFDIAETKCIDREVLRRMKHAKARSNGMLILTALIWGVAFVAQSVGTHIGSFTFNAVRNLIGCIVLLPCIFLLDRIGGRKQEETNQLPEEKKKSSRKLLLGGICCGTALAVASSLQQFGLVYTTVGKAGFITALYIVIVPILGIFFRKRVSLLVWLSVLMAVAGMYLLCITEGFSIGTGDLLVLASAFCFSIHILVIDYFARFVDGVRMSCIQFLTCGVLCAIPALIWEQPQVSDIISAWLPILYAGVLSCGVAYTLQIVAQKHTSPVVASLLLSLESVFAVLAGWIILGEQLSPRELIGCALVFCAILLAQLPDFRRKPHIVKSDR